MAKHCQVIERTSEAAMLQMALVRDPIPVSGSFRIAAGRGEGGGSPSPGSMS